MIYKYILLFFMYSIFGWLMETTIQFVLKHKWVNRGFLIGPYCPIYGTGAIIIHLFLRGYITDFKVLFVMSIVVCAILEYLISYIMEKLFKARWWDYSDKKFNINGRICLETSIPFGVLGTLSVYIVNPFIFDLLNKVPISIIRMSSVVITFVLFLDMAVSLNIISRFRESTFNLKEDNSELISLKVKKELIKISKSYKRLLQSFPKLVIKKDN